MTQRFTNNARTTLASFLSDSATSLSVAAGTGDLFPEAGATTAGGEDWFKAVLQDETGEIEIIYVYTRAAGSDLLADVVRARENTAARNWASGETVVGAVGAQNFQDVFVVANWTGDNTAFPDYNGLFTGTTEANDDIVLIGTPSSPGIGIFNGADFYVNGVYQAPAFPALTSTTLLQKSQPSPMDVIGYQLGNDRDNAGRNWVGAVAEVLAFDYVLETADRQVVEGYLAHKWGFAAALPEAHPYYDNPPLVA